MPLVHNTVLALAAEPAGPRTATLGSCSPRTLLTLAAATIDAAGAPTRRIHSGQEVDRLSGWRFLHPPGNHEKPNDPGKDRSEERRVGKECRGGKAAEYLKREP